jgi:hypothetical protein
MTVRRPFTAFCIGRPAFCVSLGDRLGLLHEDAGLPDSVPVRRPDDRVVPQLLGEHVMRRFWLVCLLVSLLASSRVVSAQPQTVSAADMRTARAVVQA